MKKLIILFIVFLLGSNSFFPSFSQDSITKQKAKTKVDKVKSIADKIDWSGEEIEQVPINVKNEFVEEVKIKLDTNKEYIIGPNESVTLGNRVPGKYTLTIYNKNGEFVDNLTRNINKLNKFILSKDTISNSDKVTGISIEPLPQPQNQNAPQTTPQQDQLVQPAPSVAATPTGQLSTNNDPALQSGKNLKFLNTRFSQLKLIVEGVDGKPLENNWILPKGNGFEKPLPLIFNGEKIVINPGQRIIARTSSGFELQRYWFELDIDPTDGSYVWVVK